MVIRNALLKIPGIVFYTAAWWQTKKSAGVKTQQAVQQGHQTHFRNISAALDTYHRDHKVMEYNRVIVNPFSRHTVGDGGILKEYFGGFLFFWCVVSPPSPTYIFWIGFFRFLAA